MLEEFEVPPCPMPINEEIQMAYEQANRGSVYGQECELEDLLEK